MSQSYFLLLLLFSSVAVVLSNPIALFFDSNALKNDNKLILRSHALILTEQYVLSPKFPLQLYNVTNLCVIPREQVTDKINKTSQHFCKDAERSREADNYDLCVTELTEPLIFTYRVEVAPLPFLKKSLVGHGVQLDFFKDCLAVLNLRLDTKPDNYPYSIGLADFDDTPYAMMMVPDRERTVVYLSIKTAKGFCDSDNGMPVYCNHVVIGMFRLNDEGKNQSQCAQQKELHYVNLVNPVAQSFLKDFYETGPWLATMAPNATENMTLAGSTTEVPPK